jgi:hypothetical protein
VSPALPWLVPGCDTYSCVSTPLCDSQPGFLTRFTLYRLPRLSSLLAYRRRVRRTSPSSIRSRRCRRAPLPSRAPPRPLLPVQQVATLPALSQAFAVSVLYRHAVTRTCAPPSAGSTKPARTSSPRARTTRSSSSTMSSIRWHRSGPLHVERTSPVLPAAQFPPVLPQQRPPRSSSAPPRA